MNERSIIRRKRGIKREGSMKDLCLWRRSNSEGSEKLKCSPATDTKRCFAAVAPRALAFSLRDFRRQIVSSRTIAAFLPFPPGIIV
ncbi:hypothetical protein MRB53_014035 [Persea americana]|uniref:Uncharacterized protein n=1 Tax=Persea americana TaxID=3435 RepID=A0ACC2KA62_PERAE|nr:hypothetical protein MRB53_014035 [Persea americana]